MCILYYIDTTITSHVGCGGTRMDCILYIEHDLQASESRGKYMHTHSYKHMYASHEHATSTNVRACTDPPSQKRKRENERFCGIFSFTPNVGSGKALSFWGACAWAATGALETLWGGDAVRWVHQTKIWGGRVDEREREYGPYSQTRKSCVFYLLNNATTWIS